MTARQAECIVGLLYAVLSAGTIRLTGDGQGLAAVWPANAVLLAALLDRRPDGWGRLLAVGYLANVATGLAMRGVGPAPFLDGLCHVAEAWIAARLLRPVLNGEDVLVAPSVVGRFILVCGLVAPALSGLGGAAVASLVSGRDPRVAFGSWVTGNGLGLLVFTPFLFALLRGDYRRCLTGKDWSRRAEALGLQGLVAATACGVFCVAERSLLFVLFGPAMLATFRVGRLGTKAAVAVIAVIGTVATLRGQGPIAAVTPDPHEQATLLHAFLAVLLLTCLPVAAALTAQGRNLRSLSRSAEALRAQRAELARLAATDGLTGVLNRTAFRETALAAMRDPRAVPSLVAIDLDLFKQVNDRHGHLAGDRALVHLVSVLRAGLREADTIGRVGGDEFLVLLPGTDADRAQAVAARLREALRRAPLSLDDGTVLLLSMSCGVAPHRDGMGFEDLVHAADMALYGAKRAGRETWMLSA
ncbi:MULTISPECIES: diguanylate cyclase [Methylobacterium]|uniref:sensor domain-containing diguanylate cyclase n=5 Tax=Methylobacteriaceae TaxID=119045 RepID=UPI0015877AEE|nr:MULTISPECIES: diguanylate cyclase [Methylobacterium]MBK3421485.1 sensor domain-containing diguanylate cyclase [Methylobacterium ajmalii]